MTPDAIEVPGSVDGAAPVGPSIDDLSFGRDIAMLIGIRLASVVAGFLTSVIAARLLGSIALGAAGIGLTIGSIAALVANGGLNIATIYFLGRRPTARREIAHQSLTLALVAAALAATLVIVVAGPIAPQLLGDLPAGLITAAAILAAGIVGFEVSVSVLLGLGRSRPYLLAQSIEGIGSLAITAFILAALMPTAPGYVLAAGFAYACAALFAVVEAQRTVGGRMLAFDRGFTREALTLGIRGQLGNVLQFLNLRLDLLLIPLFVDLRAVGIYLIAVRMSEVVAQTASAAAAFLFPAVSRSRVTHAELTERTTRATLLVVALSGVVVALLAENLLRVFFGSDFQSGAAALRITMLAMVPLALTRLLAGDLKGRGRPGVVSIAAGLALSVTVLADLALIPLWGIEGAALASLVAYSTGASVLLVGFRRITGSSAMLLIPGPADGRFVMAAAAQVIAEIRRRRRGPP